MRYLLDTNICVYIMNYRPPLVLAKFQQLPSGECGMSVVTYAELMFGVFKSQHVERNLTIVQGIAQEIPVAPLPSEAALEYGRLRAHLQKKGQLIGGNDLLIAAHALCLGLPLVTNNTREFKRVPGLKVENWLT